MQRLFLLALIVLACISAQAATPTLGPVIVVAFENHSYASVMGSTGTAAMPYLHSLMNNYTLATNFYAQANGSVPDYFMITTGNPVSCCTSYVGPYAGNNLARVLNAAGKSWKVFAQGLPSPGYLGTCCYPYVKYHNPFAYFSDVTGSSTQKANILPLSSLGGSIGNLPSFSLIIPDNRHNAHDCPNGGTNCTNYDKLHAADLFLQTYIPAILSSSQFQANGLLIIWWDEGSGGSYRTAITFVGPLVNNGYKSGVFYKDANMLRTIIQGLHGGSYPGASASAAPMSDIFK